MEACIYVVKSLLTSQIIYVGKTSNPNKRWSRHKAHKGGRLYKYMSENGGLINFELVPVIWFESEEMAFEAEAYFIQLCLEQQVPLINQDRGGIGTISGRSASKETCQKLSEIQKERWKNESFREKILTYLRENKNSRIAKLHTPEARKKQSESRIQKYKLLSHEARTELTKKATEAIRGTKLTQDRKDQISDARRKWFENNPSAREEVGRWRKGQRHTEETKRCIAVKRKLLSDEQISICLKLHSEGISMKKISKEIGTSVKPVFNLINGIGIYKQLGNY